MIDCCSLTNGNCQSSLINGQCNHHVGHIGAGGSGHDKLAERLKEGIAVVAFEKIIWIKAGIMRALKCVIEGDCAGGICRAVGAIGAERSNRT